MPSWSPDGQNIAYYYSQDQTETSNVSPWIVNAHDNSTPRPATSSAVNLTCLELIIDELHISMIGRPQWFPDSHSLLVTVQERGQIHLYRLDIEHDQTVKLTSGNGCYINPQLSTDGQTITMIRTDWFTPGDVWSMGSNGENRHKLTGVNDTLLRSRQLVRPKRITWQSSDGLEIEGWLYLPPLQQGVKAPLILEIHGGPTLAWGDSYVHEFQVLAGNGYAVLAANPRGSVGYGEEFCKKSMNDWGGNDFRDLIAGIDHVLTTEPVDGTRLGIGGLSYGGYMTNWAITQTNRFKAAVSRNGISSLFSAGLLSDGTIGFDLVMSGTGSESGQSFQQSRSALTFADNINTPLLLLHADNDLRCPFSESYQLFVTLRKRKHTVELVRYPGVSHLIDWPDCGTPKQRTDRLHRTVEWFQRFV
jgi:dipeptidyl aminopeptidase/acylaminoacyl peptidase